MPKHSAEPRKAVVYSITINRGDNRPNGIYIGKTIDFEGRKHGHLKTASLGLGQSVHAAIRKYGEDSCEFKIEREFSSEKDALLFESEMIASMRKSDLVVYNRTSGGEGATSDDCKAFHAARTEEQKRLKSERLKASYNREAGSKRMKDWWASLTKDERIEMTARAQASITPEMRKEAVRKRSERMNYEVMSLATTKMHSKLSQDEKTRRGKKPWENISSADKERILEAAAAAKRKPVISSDGTVYGSIVECANALGVSSTAVSSAIRRSYKCRGLQLNFVHDRRE